jgi:hypothetical protein
MDNAFKKNDLAVPNCIRARIASLSAQTTSKLLSTPCYGSEVAFTWWSRFIYVFERFKNDFMLKKYV